jgi:hypothetical protein
MGKFHQQHKPCILLKQSAHPSQCHAFRALEIHFEKIDPLTCREIIIQGIGLHGPALPGFLVRRIHTDIALVHKGGIQQDLFGLLA